MYMFGGEVTDLEFYINIIDMWNSKYLSAAVEKKGSNLMDIKQR